VVREGDVLAGKYRIERILGVGGMGMVVAAHHGELDQRVAIKFLLPEMLSNSDAVIRFAREARAAVKIKGEHVARVFDVGTLETGAPYMVMEYLDGIDLGTWIHQHGALPIAQAADFLIQACVAIAEAHGLGIIHRDIKPSNLFCVRGADGRLIIKILDFGIAKITTFNAAGQGIVTKTLAIMGSPLYMSPEQTQSARDVDARADIWALGIVLYELLSGRVPFAGETMGEIIVKIVTQTPDPLRTLRPDVPDGLEAVFRKCTEKNRERRYGNVSDLAFALLPYAPRSSKAEVEKVARIVESAGLSATGLSPQPRPYGTAETQSTTHTGLGNTKRPTLTGRSKTMAVVGGGAIAIAMAVAGVWLSSARVRHLDPSTAPGSSTVGVPAAPSTSVILARAWVVREAPSGPGMSVASQPPLDPGTRPALPPPLDPGTRLAPPPPSDPERLPIVVSAPGVGPDAGRSLADEASKSTEQPKNVARPHPTNPPFAPRVPPPPEQASHPPLRQTRSAAASTSASDSIDNLKPYQ
jgi:serine/threonine protein kinase